jgi:hypothetical protein
MIWGFLGYCGFVPPIELRSPFVTRGHYEDVVGELRRQIAEKELERQKCWDLLAQMGFGTKVFDCSSRVAGSGQALKIIEDEGTTAEAPSPQQANIGLAGGPVAVPQEARTPTIPIARLRPSQIMRRMDMEKLREYQEKHRLARKAEVLAEVTAIVNGKALDSG